MAELMAIAYLTLREMVTSITGALVFRRDTVFSKVSFKMPDETSDRNVFTHG
jgi:hypothetical protein